MPLQGCLAIASCLGPNANSRFCNGSPNERPETAFVLDNQLGPKYIASQSLVTQKSTEENLPDLPVMRRVEYDLLLITTGKS